MIGPERFCGTVERLASVDASALTRWIAAIPLEDWPQQDRVNGQLRPAMVNDRQWHDFGRMSDPLVADVLARVPGGVELGRLLSVVMPGHHIPPHVDKVAPRWWGRVHVPLTSDPASRFIVGSDAHHLQPGYAYLVNITIAHSVEHHGTTPRIHFMVDLGGRS